MVFYQDDKMEKKIIKMTAAHKLLISVLSMRTSAQDFKLFIVIKLKYIICTYNIR
jgi:hypothetical protein